MDTQDEKLIVGRYVKPNIPTIGLLNLVFDRDEEMLSRFNYVVFIDYDFINEKIVEEELEWIVEKYKLTNFYLFYTKREEDKEATNDFERYYGNYSAISLTKLPFYQIIEILKETTCDANYLMVPTFTRYKSWILRIIGKDLPIPPKFLKIIPEKPVNMDRRISRVHKEFLEKWYGVPKLPYQNLDNSSTLLITPYLTNKSQRDENGSK